MRAMPAPLLMVGASLLFALMAVCVKLASARYGAAEIVFYRALVGLVLMAGVLRARHVDWRTRVPGLHFWRSAAGTTALCLWFYAIGALPLATAMTLNYLSSVWIALFLIGGALLLPTRRRVDSRLVAAVLAGFVGVALVLRPTLAQDQLWHGLVGLLSGMLSAVAYLQVSALGRAGEPGERVVLYFSLSGTLAGAVLVVFTGGPTAHTWPGAGLLLATGLLATLAQWLLTAAYARGATLGMAALQYLGILFGVIFGVLLFDDPLTPLALAGMLLIVAAGVAATLLMAYTPAPKPQHPPPTQT